MPARYALLLGTLLLLTSHAASAATCTWNGSAGTWTTASAWSCGAVPGPTDDAVVGSGTVTLAASAQVRDLTVTGGTIDGAGDLTITGTFVWEAGTMAGSGTTTADGATALRGAVSKDVARRVVLTSTVWSSGTLQMRDGGALINEGVFVDNSAGSHSIARVGTISTEPIVVNRGAWRVESVGTNTNVEFSNEGSLLVAGAGFKVISPGRFINGETGALAGTAPLDLASGPHVSMSGTTRPGGSVPGLFPVLGPFPMTSRHVLDVDLAGRAASDYDRLLVENGAVTVAGRLRVRVGSEAVAGGTYPVLSVTGSGTLTGCYGPDDIDVVSPDGTTGVPYTASVSCTSTGVSVTVQPATAGDAGPDAVGGRLVVTGANPFSGRTALAVTAPVSGPVSVEAVDALGRRVAVLFEGAVAAGHAVPVAFDARALPAGLYVVRATGDGFALRQTLTLLR